MRYSKLSEQFTYGFEIEGAFGCKLLKGLYDDGRKKGYCLDEKEDGSVNVGVPQVKRYKFEDPDELQELGIGIFENLKAMLDVVRHFKNDKNYLQDDSCGLHVHIKPKDDEELKRRIFDYDFIRHLQKWASDNLCEEIRYRIAHSSFCRPHGGLLNMYTSVNHQAKHVFVGNHPQKTLEFRFFSTCEHKTKNIELFFREFFRELAKIEIGKSKNFRLQSSGDEEILKVVHKYSSDAEAVTQNHKIRSADSWERGEGEEKSDMEIRRLLGLSSYNF